MGKKRRKRRSKASKIKKDNPSKLKNKLTQIKYHDLNLKAQDMLKRMGLDSERIHFIDNPGEIKMSAVILKLAEPYLKRYWGNDFRIRGIIFLAIMVWNMNFLSQKEQIETQEKWIEDALPKCCDARDVAVMLHVFEKLQERKRNLFPDIKTFILEYDLRLDSKNIHLDVSSGLLGKKK